MKTDTGHEAVSETNTAQDTKHTPGPWSRVPGATNGLDIPCAHVGTVQSDHWHVALVFADGNIGVETAEANARLIAAAPELLAALCALFTVCDEELAHIRVFPERDAARAAIAKAKP